MARLASLPLLILATLLLVAAASASVFRATTSLAQPRPDEQLEGDGVVIPAAPGSSWSPVSSWLVPAGGDSTAGEDEARWGSVPAPLERKEGENEGEKYSVSKGDTEETEERGEGQEAQAELSETPVRGRMLAARPHHSQKAASTQHKHHSKASKGHHHQKKQHAKKTIKSKTTVKSKTMVKSKAAAKKVTTVKTNAKASNLKTSGLATFGNGGITLVNNKKTKVNNKDATLVPPTPSGGGITVTPGVKVPPVVPSPPPVRLFLNPPPPPVAPKTQSDVVAALQSVRYSISATNIVRSNVLSKASGCTLFAPSNFAWRRWMFNITSVVAEALGGAYGAEVVTRLMQYHMLPTQMSAAEIISASPANMTTTFSSQKIQVTTFLGRIIQVKSIPILFKLGRVITKDFLVGDGFCTVHLINRVLQPDETILTGGLAPAPAPTGPAPSVTRATEKQ